MKKVDGFSAINLVFDEKMSADYEKVKQLNESGNFKEEVQALTDESNELFELSHGLQEMLDILYK